MKKLLKPSACVAIALIASLIMCVPSAYATKYYGIQTTKVYSSKYDIRAQNWIEPMKTFMGYGTTAYCQAYDVPRGYLKLKAQSAYSNKKIASSGSWTANSQIIDRVNPHQVYISRGENTNNTCSYGQMAFKNGTALTGVTQIFASPYKSL